GDVEEAIAVEDAGVLELVLRVALAAPPRLLDEPGVGERRLGVAVQGARVGVRRGGVQVVVELLGILAVVSLVAGKAVEALLEDRVAAVPQGEREAQPPLAVAPAEEPVLAPAIDAAARVLVREVLPRRPSGGVVLAHGAPLTLAQVRPPPLPVFLAVEVLVE